jgi:hypothetical protein
MKRITIFLLSFLMVCSLFAEVNSSKHRICFDLGGSASAINMEYQLQIHESERHSVFLAAGMGMNLTNFSFPIGLNYGFGYKNQLLAGIYFIPRLESLFSDGNAPVSYLLSPRFGYRKIINGRNNAHLIQMYFSPAFNLATGILIPSGGIGFGIYL